MIKNIFVTGGAGYVGSALVPKLLNSGYNVTVYDLMIYGDPFLKKTKNLKIVKGDLRDIKLLEKHLVEQDCVIHLACISNDPSFELNPSLGKEINLDSFEPLVKAAKKNKNKKFIYASSSSVYGIKKTKSVDEEMLLEPLTDYSKYKAECEKILINFNSDSFTTTILRPATVCGYAPRLRLDVVVNILTNLAYNKREITVFGGDQLRPNIHINDMVEAYIKVLQAPAELISGEIFNVGSDNHSVNHLAKAVKKIIGEDVEVVNVKSNDDRSYHISSNKIEKILNFKTNLLVEDAVKDLKNAFDNNLVPDSLNDDKYFNIKTMKKINLK